MDGCGDIEIKYITREELKAMAPEQKEYLAFSFMQSIANTCHNRPKVCDKKYVKVRHVIFASMCVVCFLVGLGVLQVRYVMPGLIQKAVTAAIVAM